MIGRRGWCMLLLAPAACGGTTARPVDVRDASIDGLSNDATTIMVPGARPVSSGLMPDATVDHDPADGAFPAQGAFSPDAGCAVGVACGARCTDTNSDPVNCGDCNRPCAATEVCSQGRCAVSCDALTACSGACVDLTADDANCGKCGAVCASGFHCTAGQCACRHTVCGEKCADTVSDPSNCGECGLGCALFDQDAAQNLFDVDASRLPVFAQFCNLGLCSVYCAGGLNLCGKSCVNTATDSDHCGNCNIACRGAAICRQGTCTCPGGASYCNGNCVSTQTSAANCGACGIACPPGVACIQGSCSVECPDGFIACENSCFDPMITKNHCGLCNQECGGDLVCQNGQCVCPAGLTACAGTCRDITLDVNNCGGCGKTCDAGACRGGSCQ
jgi:hypothetical protein